MTMYNVIDVPKGQDSVLRFRRRHCNADDISSWTLLFNIKATPALNQDPSALPILWQATTGNGGVVIRDGPAGVFWVYFLSASSLGLGYGEFFHDIWRNETGKQTQLSYGPFRNGITARW